MDTEEAEVCAFLKMWAGQFVSAREVCRRAGGKWRYREDERWALPVLQRLFEKKVVEADAAGHYRLVTQEPTSSAMHHRFPQSATDCGVILLEELGSEDSLPGISLPARVSVEFVPST